MISNFITTILDSVSIMVVKVAALTTNMKCIIFIILTLNVIAANSVRKFRIRSPCITTVRKVTFVIGFGSNGINSINSDLNKFLMDYYYKPLKKELGKYTNGPCVCELSLTYITQGDIAKMSAKESEEQPALISQPFHGTPRENGEMEQEESVVEIPFFDGTSDDPDFSGEEISREEIENAHDGSKDEQYDWSRVLEFLDQYEARIDDSDSKLLIIYLDDFPQVVILKLKNIMLRSPIILVSKDHKRLSLVNQFPQHSIMLITLYFKQQRQIDKYLLPILNVMKNPSFDRFEFIEKTPMEKDTSCLQNITFVWMFSTIFFEYEDNFFQLLLQLNSMHTSKQKIMEHLQVEDSKYLNTFAAHNELWFFNLLKQQQNIYTKFTNFSETMKVLEEDLNQIIITDSSTIPYSKVLAESKIPSVAIEMISNQYYKLPYREGNKIYCLAKDANSNLALNLLLDVMIELKC